jgi:hypothetical protein
VSGKADDVEDEVEDAMEVVGPRKPTLALPLPLPRPSIVDRQRTGGLFASIVKCVGQQKPAPGLPGTGEGARTMIAKPHPSHVEATRQVLAGHLGKAIAPGGMVAVVGAAGVAGGAADAAMAAQAAAMMMTPTKIVAAQRIARRQV